MLQRTDKYVCNIDLEASDTVERVLQVHPIIFENLQRIHQDPVFKEAISSIALHLRFPSDMIDRGTVESDVGLLVKRNSVGQFLSHPNSYLAWTLGCKLSNVCELGSRQSNCLPVPFELDASIASLLFCPLLSVSLCCSTKTGLTLR